MDPLLFLTQALNGLQLGIMNLVNLAHGSLYMVGAYLMAAFQGWTGSFVLGLLLAVPATLVVGVLVELIVLRRLYDRDHLDQVLATFGLILFFNELVRVIWGPAALFVSIPKALEGTVVIVPGAPYPIYRLAIIVVGLAVAGFLSWLVTRTRTGALIRAGAASRTMVAALGIDIGLLFTLVFGLGAALAGLAGAMAAPLLSVESGMGDGVLILTFVVIVIGGVGSIRGAFVASVLVGVVDTVGRAFLPILLREIFNRSVANAAGPALASMLIYLLMAAILAFRPRGLFSVRNG